jgi:hypothetical protein
VTRPAKIPAVAPWSESDTIGDDRYAMRNVRCSPAAAGAHQEPGLLADTDLEPAVGPATRYSQDL